MGKEKDVTLRKVAGIANMAHWPMLETAHTTLQKLLHWQSARKSRILQFMIS